MSPRVFLGLGQIGAGLALAALDRGEHLVLHNRTRAKAEAVAAHAPDRCTVTDTPAQAVAGAQRIHLALTADDAVDATLDAILPHLADDAVVMDHSTTAVDRTRARAERLAAAGVAFLHCPVFMSPQACREARGFLMAAGPEAVVEAVAAELSAMTGELWRTGTDPGSAAVTKLMGNAGIVSVVGMVADAMAIARQSGVAPEEALALFAKFNPLGSMVRRATWALADDLDARWTLRMARKDVGLMLRAGEGRDLAVLPGLADRMDALIADGAGELDLAALVRPSVLP